MCTVLISHGVVLSDTGTTGATNHHYRVFVAANRDESYNRPSAPPQVHGTAPHRWFGPSDERARGTWLGINEHGLYAVITNRSDLRVTATPQQRSRGLLVRDILESVSLEHAQELWRKSVEQDSQPYNLLFGTAEELWLATRDDRNSMLRQLPMGTYAFSNFGSPERDDVGEVDRALEEWNSGRERGEDPWITARAMLKTGPDGDRPGLEKSFRDRGTVSSSILAIAVDGRVRYQHAHGAPSTTEFRTTDPVDFGEDRP